MAGESRCGGLRWDLSLGMAVALCATQAAAFGSAAFNVLNYGADPTGVVSATPAVQAAISDALGASTGVVYFPPGKYNLTSQVTVSGAASQDITFLGAGGAGAAETQLVSDIASAVFVVTGTGPVRFVDLAFAQGPAGFGSFIGATGPGGSLFIRGCAFSGGTNGGTMVQLGVGLASILGSTFGATGSGETGISVVGSGSTVAIDLLDNGFSTTAPGSSAVSIIPQAAGGSVVVTMSRNNFNNVSVSACGNGLSLLDNTFVIPTISQPALLFDGTCLASNGHAGGLGSLVLRDNQLLGSVVQGTIVKINQGQRILVDGNVLEAIGGRVTGVTVTNASEVLIDNNIFTGVSQSGNNGLEVGTLSQSIAVGNIFSSLSLDLGGGATLDREFENVCLDSPSFCNLRP